METVRQEATPAGVPATHDAFKCECDDGLCWAPTGPNTDEMKRCQKCNGVGHLPAIECDCGDELVPEAVRGLDGPHALCLRCFIIRVIQPFQDGLDLSKGGLT